jgi:hypothetical protein
MGRRRPAVLGQQPPLLSPELINKPLPGGVMVFASGMNRLADLNAAIAARTPIGVDVSRISESVIQRICVSGIPVLLDSGAFSEVAIRNGAIEIRKTIAGHEWRRRLSIYSRITLGLCPKVAVIVVAPDRVGSQEITLERLECYREEVRQLHYAGALILVPLQVGKLSLTEFFTAAKKVLSVDILPGLPMNKAAASADAIIRFIRSTGVQQIHFLGMGARNRKTKPLLRVLRHMWPAIHISMDANSVRAAVGTRRQVTVQEAAFADDMRASWSSEVDLRQWSGEYFDRTEMLYQPSLWLSQESLKQLTNSLTWLTTEQRRELAADPDRFVNAEGNENGWIDEALMQAYFEVVKKQCRQGARTRAIVEYLQRSQIAYQV